ncbi:MAG TPA: lipoate--protein ligase family protein [Burkholderiaceae bacterium]|nr:lipoate--protein ligase family protein [Burkholderiaceae bacterium]
MSFTLLPSEPGQAQHARFDEFLMRRAAQGSPVACIWRTGQGLVVPRTYHRLPRFAEACRRFARLGWPVTVRQSGGGLVPQGPGILNISLAYMAAGQPLSQSDAAYQSLCALISGALNDLGIATRPQAVTGSFCDGRYNLAWLDDSGTARKIAGTAQLWRRVAPEGDTPTIRDAPGRTDAVQVVLAHALLLAAVDTDAVTRIANGFERASGHDKHYDPDTISSLHAILGIAADASNVFMTDLTNGLAQHIAAASPPASTQTP